MNLKRVGVTLCGSVWLLNLVVGVFAEDYTQYVNLLVGTQGAIPGVSSFYILFQRNARRLLFIYRAALVEVRQFACFLCTKAP